MSWPDRRCHTEPGLGPEISGASLAVFLVSDLLAPVKAGRH